MMKQAHGESEVWIYSERITSFRTESLFLMLMLFFLALSIWRIMIGYFDFLTGILLLFYSIFLFYGLNYRTLIIRLSPLLLELTFGLFTWKVPLENIQNCCLDELPGWLRYGGAGIHFMTVRKRYRASFNFLEYPRIVISLKRKVGPVQEISFSSSRPDTLIRILQEAKEAVVSHPSVLRE